MKVLFFKGIATALVATSFLVACNEGDKNNEGKPENHENHSSVPEQTVPTQLVAAISGTYADTVVNGTATFTQLDNGKVKMELSISAPSRANKSVAVHLHEHGDCGDNGNNSHGHWNPTQKNHGKWGDNTGFHSGDIGNVALDAQGNGSAVLETELWSIGGADDKNIMGRAIIVHGGTDDYKTQPTGNAGNRIGCGLIK